MVDILNAFFQEHVGDHRHNNLEISERGGEPLVRGEGGPRSRARRVGARQGGVNGTISSTARAIISPTMRPHRSQERVSWHLRSVLDSATTDPVPCLDVCAFKPFRNDPSRAQLAVARKISIIHVAYTITISSLSLRSSILFDFQEMEKIASSYYPSISRSLSLIKLLIFFFFFKKIFEYINLMFFDSSGLSRDKIIFFVARFLHERYCIGDRKGLKRGLIKLKYGGDDN